MDVRIAAPASLQPDARCAGAADGWPSASEARITVTEDVAEAVAGADFSTPTSGCRWESRSRRGETGSGSSFRTR